MQAMIVEGDATLRSAIASALARAGFDVTCMADVEEARAHLRSAGVDVLVTAEVVGERLAHDVALLAEWRNPLVASLLLTDREGAELDELFDLLPSLHAIVGRGTPPKTLARLALEAAGAGVAETAAERLARRWAEAGGGMTEEEACAPAPAIPSFLRRAADAPAAAPLVLLDPVVVPSRPASRAAGLADLAAVRHAGAEPRRLHLA